VVDIVFIYLNWIKCSVYLLLCYIFQHVCNNWVQANGTNCWFMFVYSLSSSSLIENSTEESHSVTNVSSPCFIPLWVLPILVVCYLSFTSSLTQPLHHLLCICSGQLCNILILTPSGDSYFCPRIMYIFTPPCYLFNEMFVWCFRFGFRPIF
jgi:hypothetical protein